MNGRHKLKLKIGCGIDGDEGLELFSIGWQVPFFRHNNHIKLSMLIAELGVESVRNRITR